MYTHDGPALWLTADKSEVVEEGDERAAFLLVATGGAVSDEDAERYGLKGRKDAPANKAKAGAAENKAAPEQAAEEASVTFTPAPALEDEGDGPKPKKAK